MRRARLVVVVGLLLALAMALALAVEAEVQKPAVCIDKKLCAEKLRFGIEAFNRGRYSEAKGYFREAVQADPGSATAWAYYDLSIMYDVAEQVKRAGTVKVSSAPVPSATQGLGAAAPPAPTGPPPATQPSRPVVVDDEGC